MVAPSSKVGNPALEDDEVGAKYISAPETNLEKRIAFGEVVTKQMHHICSHAFGILAFVLFPLIKILILR